MRADSDSSSSDFSSDEEIEQLPTGVSYPSTLTPRLVEVELVEDEETDALDDLNGDDHEDVANDLLATLRDSAVPEPLLQATEPLLASQVYSYDAYSTALYYMATLWPEDASANTQRALHRTRAVIYRRFHRAFPLTPEMYSEYISDVDATRAKLQLYEQAMRDYWSVPLSLQHLQLVSENENVLPGLSWSKVLETMEFLLNTVGHHYTQGADVWTLCRELTSQHFDELDDAKQDDYGKERALRDLFMRQMRLPLQQNDLVMSEFRAWNQYNTLETTEIRDQAIEQAEQSQQRVFGGASGVYKKLNQYETRLTTASVPSGSEDSEQETPEHVWIQYLQYVQFKVVALLSSPEQARGYVVCLMERAVASVCLSATLWRTYVAYVQSSGGFSREQLTSVVQRATRNVSFDSFVWCEWLLAMETNRVPLHEISEAIETALLTRTAPPLMDSAHMARVLTSYCALVRRVASEDGDDDAKLDAAIKRCRDFVATAFPAEQDAALTTAALLTFQTQCLVYSQRHGAWQDKWWKVWQELLQIRGAQAETWLSLYDEYRFVYAALLPPQLAQQLRDHVFKPAVDHVRDYPLVVLEKWLQFEQSVGDLSAYTKVKLAFETLQAQETTRLQYQQQQAQASTTAGAAAAVDVAAVPATEKPVAKKRKAESSSNNSASQPTAAKRQKPSAETTKTERFTNEHTVFVCNMSKTATAEELRALFAHIPTLRDVRLVTKERGSHVKSRGMAYVQFTEDAGVVAALAVHGTELHGQAIKVERSLPPQSKSAGKTTGGSGGTTTGSGAKAAATTLYVGGLLPAERDPITEAQVQQALVEILDGGESAVKQVLILTDKRGRPKEYGLVQLQEPRLVQEAIRKHAQLQLKLGDQVTVQTSRMTIDQVVRHRDEQKQESLKSKQAKQQQQSKSQPPAVEYRAKTAPHATPTPRLKVASLMPRALRKKTITTATTTTTSSSSAVKNDAVPTTTTTTIASAMPAPAAQNASGASAATASTPPVSKSNADFRKLFMN